MRKNRRPHLEPAELQYRQWAREQQRLRNAHQSKEALKFVGLSLLTGGLYGVHYVKTHRAA